MNDNTLSHTDTALPFARRQGEPRDSTVGGSVTAEERERVQKALDQGRFASASEGVRVVMLAYVEVAAIRDLVAEWRQNESRSAA
jgi:hypothetical protein